LNSSPTTHEDRPSSPTDWQFTVLAPLAVAIIVLATLWLIGRERNPGPLGFRLDDAWIHMVYGRGLLADGVLSYNPGQASTGSTSPLWSVCVALAHAVTTWSSSTTATVIVVLLMGVACHLSVAWLSADLAARLTGNRVAGMAAGILVSLSTPLAAAAFSGMEVSLCAALLLAAVRAVVLQSWVRAGIWLALAAVTRPEAGIVSIACFLATAFDRSNFSAFRKRAGNLARLAAPSVAAGSLFMGYNFWIIGSPFPSTFHMKRSGAPLAVPERLITAVSKIYTQAPPTQAYLGWLFLLGLAPRRVRREASGDVLLPLAAATAFFLANLAVIGPEDPEAFYHVRYLLPAIPLFIIAFVCGADGMGRLVSTRFRSAPIAVLAMIGVIGCLTTVSRESRGFHNDVRNINEVQRRMGEWLGENTAPGQRIAATDAGAVRYFSDRPMIDLLGLNTPEFVWDGEEFIRSHPVVAIAIMPDWFRPAKEDDLRILYVAKTDDYTVSRYPRMAVQAIVTATGQKGDPKRRLRFEGFRQFELDCIPGFPDVSEVGSASSGSTRATGADGGREGNGAASTQLPWLNNE
jgi:hypothetical protein